MTTAPEIPPAPVSCRCPRCERVWTQTPGLPGDPLPGHDKPPTPKTKAGPKCPSRDSVRDAVECHLQHVLRKAKALRDTAASRRRIAPRPPAPASPIPYEDQAAVLEHEALRLQAYLKRA